MLKKRISMLLVAVMIITGIPCMPKTEVSAASKDTYTICLLYTSKNHFR